MVFLTNLRKISQQRLCGVTTHFEKFLGHPRISANLSRVHTNSQGYKLLYTLILPPFSARMSCHFIKYLKLTSFSSASLHPHLTPRAASKSSAQLGLTCLPLPTPNTTSSPIETAESRVVVLVNITTSPRKQSCALSPQIFSQTALHLQIRTIRLPTVPLPHFRGLAVCLSPRMTSGMLSSRLWSLALVAKVLPMKRGATKTRPKFWHMSK